MIYLHIYDNLVNIKRQSKVLLYNNLSHYLGKNVTEKDITTNSNGKPIVNGLHYSVSHSKKLLAQAFTPHSALGIDVEHINCKRNYIALAKRYYHPDEYKLIKSINPMKACQLFYMLWCLKEAVCKAEGGRLWYYLSHNYLDQTKQLNKTMNGLNLTTINTIEGFGCAIASYESHPIRVII